MSTEAHTAGNPRDPLIGREREFDELMAALDDMRAGRGRVVILSGEAGIGKTRLAEEAARRAIAAGAHVMWGRCWESGGAPAYWPWIQVLRESLRSLNGRAQLAEVSTALAQISEVLPELKSALAVSDPNTTVTDSASASSATDAPPVARLRALDPVPGDFEPARFRLFDSVSTVLRHVGMIVPIMIVLDDLHAADTDSLLLLKFVARDLRQCKILLVGTFRETEVNDSPQQSAILAEVTREGHTIPLRGLSRAETAALINSHTDIAADDALVDSLYHATEGNPFFLDETVRLMIVEGKFRRVGLIDTAFAIPESVRAAVRRSLTVLPADATSVLTIGAVIGHEFDLVTLAEVSRLPREDLVDSLDHARTRGIIAEAPGAVGRYRFTHAIIPESLRADLGMTSSMRLHRRVADALEQIHRADPGPHYAELAYHFSESIALGAADKALEYARLGAARAREQLAYEEAARLYQMALGAHSALSNPSAAERCELLIALGDTQSKAGLLAVAKRTFHQAADLARGLKRTDLLARAALEASTGLSTFFVVDTELVALLEEASAAVGTQDPATRAALLARLAHELRWSDRREHAISLCRRAIEVAREAADTRALISALWTEHELFWGPENIDKRLATAAEISRLALESGYTRWVLRAHEMRLSAMLEIGDIAAADAEIEASEELKTRSGHAFATVERFRVTRALMSGDFAQAETWINERMRQAQRRQDAALITSFGSLLLMLRGEQGRLDDFEGPLKGSVARFPAMTAARCSLALFYVRTGRESEARAELEVLARDGFARISRDWNWLGSLAICAEVCATLGDVPRAATLYKLLSGFADRNVTIGWGDICYGSVSRYLGLLASTMRRFEDAERHFEDAIRFELKMGAAPFAARTRVCYAAMLIERGAGADHQRAQAILDTAIDTATRLKMAGLVRQATSIAAHLTGAGAPVAAAAPLEGGFAVGAAAAQRRLATIMFLDIVDSTGRAARMGDSHWSGILEQYYALVRDELRKFFGREINTFGDDFFALFEAPAQAVRCACAIRAAMSEIGLQVRAGLHTGECEVSGDKVAGIAVHIGARVVRKAAPGEVIVSATVKDLVAGAGFEFSDRGIHELRGVPGEWHLFAAK